MPPSLQGDRLNPAMEARCAAPTPCNCREPLSRISQIGRHPVHLVCRLSRDRSDPEAVFWVLRLFQRLTRKPVATKGVKRLNFRPLQSWHVGFDLIPDLGLDIGEVSVALGEALQKLLVQLDGCAWIDGIETIL